MMYTILQIIPAADGAYYIIEKKDVGLYRQEPRDVRYRVIAWALVKRGEFISVEPMILAQRGLVVMQSDSQWEIFRI